MTMIFHGACVADVMVGDWIASLRKLHTRSINCCVTSPPYYGLRDYGHDEQIGLEVSPEKYVSRLVHGFQQVRRALRDDGTLWLIIGDSYATDPKGKEGGAATSGLAGGGKYQAEATPGGAPRFKYRDVGLKKKDLIGIPWMLAFALRADGWYLRQDIIWNKPNPMPESVRDRCTKAHEYVFLLSKSERYFYDHEAIKEPVVKGASGSSFNKGKTAVHQLNRASDAARIDGETRNKRDVWTVAPKPYAGAHFAVYPPELITPCILAGCPVGGVVLDPFGGSGTTAGVSLAHGRNAIIFELNPEYAALMPDRAKYIIDRTVPPIKVAA